MLQHIDEILSSIINYELGLWQGNLVFPYWIGEYQVIEYSSEQEYTEYDFTLTGTNRETWSNLFEDKEKIRKLLGDYKAILPDGHSVAISYEGDYLIPSQDAEIKRLQVHLNIKEWGY